MNKLRRNIAIDIIRNPEKVIPYFESATQILREGDITKVRYRGVMQNGTHGLIESRNSYIQYIADVNIKGRKAQMYFDMYVNKKESSKGVFKGTKTLDRYIHFKTKPNK